MGFNPCDTCTADEAEDNFCDDCEINNVRAELNAAEICINKIDALVTRHAESGGVYTTLITEIRGIIKEWEAS